MEYTCARTKTIISHFLSRKPGKNAGRQAMIYRGVQRRNTGAHTSEATSQDHSIQVAGAACVRVQSLTRRSAGIKVVKLVGGHDRACSIIGRSSAILLIQPPDFGATRDVPLFIENILFLRIRLAGRNDSEVNQARAQSADA